MAAKKKSKKKTTNAKKTTSPTAALKRTAKKKPPKKRGTTKAKLARKKPVRKKTLKAPKKRAKAKEQVKNKVAYPSAVRSGRQSGDLQGISRREAADSESVDELLEEGNTFEAGIVTGVEEAGDEEPKEVHTHQVPEDDVPQEYLDEE